jgi:SAM-dependent methyltransferase
MSTPLPAEKPRRSRPSASSAQASREPAADGTTAAVRAFYDALEDSTQEQINAVRGRNQISTCAPLHRLLKERPARVLDIGSGSGWFVNSVARWYGVPAFGVDLSETAVSRARDVAEALGVSHLVEHMVGDIFDLPAPIRAHTYPLVNALNALHHTADCHEGVRLAAERVEPGGYFHVGLYHLYGREPLLDLFAGVRQRCETAGSWHERRARELEGFRVWSSLHRSQQNAALLFSQYLDQCLNPHETRWTVADVLGWFEQLDIEPIATSLNRFHRQPHWPQVIADEPHQATLARTRLREGVFFPGTFSVFGRKRRGPQGQAAAATV